jgi:RNA-directed DNA polymerase
MARKQEEYSSRVPDAANHDEETNQERRDRFWYVEPAIWSERMIAALETGVKGGKWYSLLDKVCAPSTLAVAWDRVRRNQGAAGVDGQSIAAFASHAERYLGEVADAVRSGQYRPQPVKRVWIEKRGSRSQRPLGIPTVKDRVVQTALKLVIEPIFEVGFAEQSYGFRPGRGCKDALRRVETLLQAGAVWVVDADLAQYFDTIPHEQLSRKVRRRIADGRVLRLLDAYLHSGVFDGLTRWEPDAGTPQGAVISPLLANIYLDDLDHEMAAHGWEMVRYADDFVLLCRSEAEAQAALAAVEQWVSGQGLHLHPDKTRIVDARKRGGFDFLGYHFERGTRWPKNAATKRLRAAVKAKTKRSRSGSLAEIIRELNPLLRGWYAYYRHSRPQTFPIVDGYVRGRLRSLLRKRAGRAGRARGYDHQRYPSAYFIAQGLFTMAEARAATGNSR